MSVDDNYYEDLYNNASYAYDETGKLIQTTNDYLVKPVTDFVMKTIEERKPEWRVKNVLSTDFIITRHAHSCNNLTSDMKILESKSIMGEIGANEKKKGVRIRPRSFYVWNIIHII